MSAPQTTNLEAAISYFLKHQPCQRNSVRSWDEEGNLCVGCSHCGDFVAFEGNRPKHWDNRDDDTDWDWHKSDPPCADNRFLRDYEPIK